MQQFFVPVRCCWFFGFQSAFAFAFHLFFNCFNKRLQFIRVELFLMKRSVFSRALFICLCCTYLLQNVRHTVEILTTFEILIMCEFVRNSCFAYTSTESSIYTVCVIFIDLEPSRMTFFIGCVVFGVLVKCVFNCIVSTFVTFVV